MLTFTAMTTVMGEGEGSGNGDGNGDDNNINNDNWEGEEEGPCRTLDKQDDEDEGH